VTTGKSDLLNKKVIIVVAFMAGSRVPVILVASPSIAQAITAQKQQYQKMKMSRWSGEAIPQINGSANVATEKKNLIDGKVNVLFVQAEQTAQGQVTSGIVSDGHLGMVQRHLIYMFFEMEKTTNQIGYPIVIDTENGLGLDTFERQPLSIFGHSSMFGHLGEGHGYGGWNRPWERQ
jgi:hypothetical protein